MPDFQCKKFTTNNFFLILIWKAKIDEFLFISMVGGYRRPNIYSVGTAGRENREYIRR